MSLSCPKSMEYGPCGGVDFDGRCEVAEHPCVFLETPTVPWRGIVGGETPPAVPRTAAAERMAGTLARRPVVIADFAARALDRDSLRRCADALAGSVDAVLAGDSGRSRVQYSPSLRAQLIQQQGLAVWSGLNCRDRNRVALEGELAGLAEVGVAGVHCVTGDHTLLGGRPDAQPVFDLDAPQLAALARSYGHLVSVAEAPVAPPVGRRAERLATKVAAGAELCFVNHCGGAAAVARFVEAARAEGVTVPFIACVPFVIDAGSAALLRSFTTLVTPPGYLERILAAYDARTEGIAAAVELSEELLSIPGVAGVDFSGGPAAGLELDFAEAMAEAACRLGLVV